MNRLIGLLFLLTLAFPVAAQERDARMDDTLPGKMEVNNVTLTRTADNALSLTVFGVPAYCNEDIFVSQARHTYRTYPPEGNWALEGTLIDVQLTSAPPDASLVNSVCAYDAPFEMTIELEGSFETDTDYILTINNFTAWVFLVRPRADHDGYDDTTG